MGITPAWAQSAIDITPRGFTGHEHVDEMGIIHMNGRIYDAHLGRFLQADPFVEDTTTLNRYTYVHNNPLSLTDPSGFLSFKKALRFVASAIVTIASFYYGVDIGGLYGFLITTAGGFAGGFIATGTLDGAFLSAGVAALSFGVVQLSRVPGADVSASAGTNSTGPAVNSAEAATSGAAAATMRTPGTIAQSGGTLTTAGASAGGDLLALPRLSVSAAAPKASTAVKVWLNQVTFQSLDTIITSYVHVLSLRHESGSYIDEASRRRAQDDLAASLGIRSGDMPWSQIQMLHQMNAVASFARGAEFFGTLFATLPFGGLPSRTASATGTATLSSRAQQIHGALDPIAQSRRTTAVLRTSGGNIVAGGARDLTPAQRALLTSGETAAKLPGAHAEITALQAAQKAGVTPQALAATRAICPQCAAAIEAYGGVLTSRTTAVFP